MPKYCCYVVVGAGGIALVMIVSAEVVDVEVTFQLLEFTHNVVAAGGGFGERLDAGIAGGTDGGEGGARAGNEFD